VSFLNLKKTIFTLEIVTDSFFFFFFFLTSGILADNITCFYWDTGSQSWSRKGVRKSNKTTANELVCELDHLTEFSVGQIKIVVNGAFSCGR
jgi:hypothetical protein